MPTPIKNQRRKKRKTREHDVSEQAKKEEKESLERLVNTCTLTQAHINKIEKAIRQKRNLLLVKIICACGGSAEFAETAHKYQRMVIATRPILNLSAQQSHTKTPKRRNKNNVQDYADTSTERGGGKKFRTGTHTHNKIPTRKRREENATTRPTATENCTHGGK